MRVSDYFIPLSVDGRLCPR